MLKNMRTAEHSAKEIGNRSARQRLPIQARPYFAHIRDGLSVGYRRGKRGGSWIARAYDTERGYRFSPLGKANDLLESVGLSFQKAQDAALLWFAGLANIDAGELTPGRYTVAMVLDEYLADSETKKRKKLAHTRQVIEGRIKPALGHIELSKLTHGQVKKWRDVLATSAPRNKTAFVKEKVWCVRTVKGTRKGQFRERATKVPAAPVQRNVDMSDPEILRKRQASANRILSVLKAALNHAKSENRRITTNAAWIDVKPFANVDVAKIRFLSTDEITALIPVCESTFQALVKAALVTGCRYGELGALTVGCFDAQQGTLFIAQSKNGESRYVHLNSEGIDFFIAMTDGRGWNETIFLRSNGNKWKASEQQRPLEDACKIADVQGVTFHILRHTYASHAAMNGMPIKVLADNLGHKDTRITERHYAHLSKGYKQEMIRAHAPTFGFTDKSGPILVQKSA